MNPTHALAYAMSFYKQLAQKYAREWYCLACGKGMNYDEIPPNSLCTCGGTIRFKERV